MRRWPILLLLALLGWAVVRSARFLILDDPKKSDALVVLAGEIEHRPARALELLDQGYAREIILDVPRNARIYQWTLAELAEKWIAGLPQAPAIRVCVTQGLSTKDEARDAAPCIRASGAHSILLVTSDYHTRRALSVFRKELPGYSYSVAAASDPVQFGERWWQHRQWAKNNTEEWMRLVWWELVDRWL
jgi:uncharacterized SAM-binding protein YcdF (DUF218 family)